MKTVLPILLYQALLILACKENSCQANGTCGQADEEMTSDSSVTKFHEITTDNIEKDDPEIKSSLRNAYLRDNEYDEEEEISNTTISSRFRSDDCLCTSARNLNFFCISTNDAGNIFSFKYSGVAKFSLEDILKAYLMYFENVSKGINKNIDINKSVMDQNFKINMEAFKNFDIHKIQVASNTEKNIFDITGFLKYFKQNNVNQVDEQYRGNQNTGYQINSAQYDVNQVNEQYRGNQNTGYQINSVQYDGNQNNNVNQVDEQYSSTQTTGYQSDRVLYDGNQNNVGGNKNDDRNAVVNQVNQLIASVLKSKSVINTNVDLNSKIEEFINVIIRNINQNQGYNSELTVTTNVDIKSQLEALRRILMKSTAYGNSNVSIYTSGVQFNVQAALEAITEAMAAVEAKLQAEAGGKGSSMMQIEKQSQSKSTAHHSTAYQGSSSGQSMMYGGGGYKFGGQFGQDGSVGLGGSAAGKVGMATGGSMGMAAGGSMGMAAGGSMGMAAGGSMGMATGGSMGMAAGGSMGMAAGGSMGMAAGGSMGMAAGGSMGMAAGGSMGMGGGGSVGFGAGGAMGMSAGGSMGMGAGGAMTMGGGGMMGMSAGGKMGMGGRGKVGFGARGSLAYGRRGYSPSDIIDSDAEDLHYHVSARRSVNSPFYINHL